MGGGTNNNISLISFTKWIKRTKTTVVAFGGTPTNLTDYLSIKLHMIHQQTHGHFITGMMEPQHLLIRLVAH